VTHLTENFNLAAAILVFAKATQTLHHIALLAKPLHVGVPMMAHLLIAGVALAALSVVAEPFADLKFDAAAKKAGQTGRIVLVDFFTTWCGPCKMLDKNTWTDARVIKLLEEKTVALRLDAEVETKLAARYKIDAYPSVLLIKPDGTEIDRLVGYRDPDTFIADFNAALGGKDSLTRAREEFAAAGTNNPMARIKYGRALLQKGKDAEALEQFLWCFDHGLETEPAFAGVRLSFLLNFIKSMAPRFPAAREALEKRRDELLAKVLAGSSDRQTVVDLVNLNGALNQKEKNLALFDKLPAASPVRSDVADLMVDQLLEARRYADVLGDRDAQAIFRTQAEQCKQTLASFPKDNPMKEQMEEGLRSFAASKGADLFEALAGLGKNEQAKELAQEIVKFDSSAETRAKLTKAAARAGNAELAQHLE
jgi:thiol-disulfide isomerase/thioredoxin